MTHVSRIGLKAAVLGVLCFLLMASASLAQGGYRQPPSEILKILEAPLTPTVAINPQGTSMLLVDRSSMPPISDLAQPIWRIAGTRLNPRTNGRSGSRRFEGLSIKDINSGELRRIELPANSNVGSPIWSPNGSHFAFTLTKPTKIELWVGDTKSAKAKRITAGQLNGASRGSFRWMPDGTHLLCQFVPEGRGPMPKEPIVPTGPVIQQTEGRVAPVRTYQDLLQNPYDVERFEWIMRSQAALVDMRTGTHSKIGKPTIWSGLNASPDGNYILSTRIRKPYSYLVTARSFPDAVEILDTKGRVVSKIASRPLRDAVPIGGVESGKRRVSWCPTYPATLTWVEALDGGDPKMKVEHRDKVMALAAPFKGEAREFIKTVHRYRGISWFETKGQGIISEYDRDRRWSRSWLFDMNKQANGAKLLFDLSTQDSYANPGSPVSVVISTGSSAIGVNKGTILLSGRGASKVGDRPFLDRLNLSTLKTERIWQCAENTYESFVSLASKDGSKIVVRSESKTSPPNYVLLDLGAKTKRKLTEFVDPAPQLRNVKKRLVTYKRDDGVELSATLYLPPNHKPGERLPLVVWAYPREFNDPKNAGQISGSPHRFTSVGGVSHLFLLTQGYAIMDRATMPVVGDPETCNDTFIKQIVASAQAAIDKAVELGVADRNRVGVGGHSYGAFMTANLLAHCDLFQAGIARSGAYNRTLTPFGFQSERRTFWEAPEIYFKLSPFMHANKINEALLLVHGEADNNSGTFPIQSKRLYHALKGNGGNSRLVMLPHESHGYRAKESIMHVLAEMVEWFDIHVKKAKTAED
ncbi:MAG: dipeptidyl aminopeptidase/acylaminoacyl peptidase [Planctomycetota bacterium]|jgi:dipeptidyl aminopeptidase/acylaminoacyl peptidase